MIYHVYWSATELGIKVTPWNQGRFPGKKIGEMVPGDNNRLAQFIKDSKDSSFLFSLANGTYRNQRKQFLTWLKENEIEDLVVAKGLGISNPVHPERYKNTDLFILQSKNHFQRKLIETEKKECASIL